VTSARLPPKAHLCCALVALLCQLAVSALAQTPASSPAGVVRLHDSPVFTLLRGEGARSAEDRARRASKALTEVTAAAEAGEVRIVKRASIATIHVGTTPIVDLTADDAEVSGEPTVDALAARVASSVRDAVETERRRNAIANTVFAVSLVVFFGLVTLYLIRMLHDFSDRARAFIQAHPERVPSLHISSLEVLGSAALRGLIVVSLGAGRWLGTLGLGYAWLLLSLSLFDATRPYTERLTGVVISPLSAFVSRLASALPILVIALLAASALVLLMRFVGLFFASVERGEVQLSWLPPELAPATSTLLRVSILLAALVFVAPLITGDAEGPLSRIGFIAVLALGLGATPLLASSAVGLSVIFSRGLSVGDRAEYGGERGEVRAIGLTVLTLEGEDGATVRVPHLRALWHPTRLLPRAKR
jgi:hypothetical protein